MKKILFILYAMASLLTSCVANQDILPGNFDKEKWRSSSHYRYEITKTKEFFVMLEGKAEREVKKLLGVPSFINSDGVFLYCLDIPSKEDKECKGSILGIDFRKSSSPYNITLIKVEPLNNK